MEARATLALKPGVWFRRGRLLIVSPDSLGTACPLSGRNSTYRLVQILEAGSQLTAKRVATLVKRAGRYHDGHGLILVVVNASNASWQLRYQRNGRERWLGLGPLHTVTLKDARERHG